MIPIIIPTGYVYSCSVSGSTFKIVQCEYCRCVYVYRMTRTGAGTATNTFFLNPMADELAGMQAHYEMERKLQDDCDAVPCLDCGKYQDNMVAALRRDFQNERVHMAKLMLWLAIPIGAFGLLSQLSAEYANDLTLVLGLFALVVALVAGGIIWKRNSAVQSYDPNTADLQERMQTARKFAKSLDEFRTYLGQLGIAWEFPVNDEAEPRRRRRPRL